MTKDIKILLFLCTGNVFRSAFCEKYFNYYYSNTPYLALSRGIDLYYESVDKTVLEVAKKYNITLKGHRPIVISEDIIQLSLKILIMDKSHKKYMENYFSEHLDKVQFLAEYYDQDEVVEIDDVKRKNSLSFINNVTQTFNVLSKTIDNIINSEK